MYIYTLNTGILIFNADYASFPKFNASDYMYIVKLNLLITTFHCRVCSKTLNTISNYIIQLHLYNYNSAPKTEIMNLKKFKRSKNEKNT